MPYLEPGRTFDAILRWFCTDTNIEQLPPEMAWLIEKTVMTTEKRDQLACQSVLWVAEAMSELDSAEIALRDNKHGDILKYLKEAREHLKHVSTLADEACAELRAEQGVADE